MFWLAELGKADNIWLFNGLNNIVDYCNAGAGIACQLNWSFSEKEVALYESPHAHYSQWLEISPVVNGEVHFSSLNAVRGRGGHPGLALGVAPGSMLQQLKKRDAALRKQQ
ncbi:g6433 [Coccomyxa viridis]|uniref:G6433 protein n=1 Tax=Coccomyxa viridis TaxID=1274662 RepID=A0ABP1FVC3_9CHLO